MLKASPKDPDSFPFLVIGNKIDMVDKICVSTTEGKKFCA